MKIEVERQVAQFIRSLAPQPRRALREALRRLQSEAGDIRALEEIWLDFTVCASAAIALFSTTSYVERLESFAVFTAMSDT